GNWRAGPDLWLRYWQGPAGAGGLSRYALSLPGRVLRHGSGSAQGAASIGAACARAGRGDRPHVLSAVEPAADRVHRVRSGLLLVDSRSAQDLRSRTQIPNATRRLLLR